LNFIGSLKYKLLVPLAITTCIILGSLNYIWAQSTKAQSIYKKINTQEQFVSALRLNLMRIKENQHNLALWNISDREYADIHIVNLKLAQRTKNQIKELKQEFSEDVYLDLIQNLRAHIDTSEVIIKGYQSSLIKDQNNIRLAVGLMVFILLISFPLTLSSLNRNLFFPLKNIIDTLNKNSAGDFSYPGQYPEKKELQELYNATNNLALSCLHYKNNLLAKNRQLHLERQKTTENEANLFHEKSRYQNRSNERLKKISYAHEQTIDLKKVIQEGNELMSQLNQSLVELHKWSLDIQEILKTTYIIADKTKIINDIVFKTELLSFCAAIEAERAGNQGEGFSVVAEEVGNLARISGNAAKELQEYIYGNQDEISHLLAISESTVTNSDDHSKAASQLFEHIEDLSAKIQLSLEDLKNFTDDSADNEQSSQHHKPSQDQLAS